MARGRVLALVLVAAAALAAAFRLPPLPQDPGYHAFADGRPLLGIPNFMNVVSNLPFIAIGAAGMAFLLGPRGAGGFRDRRERRTWFLVFGSVFLVGWGSAYYHWNPTPESLFWDRLPLTLLFTSFLGALIIERIDARWGARLLPALVAAGVATLLWARSRNDLRFYVLLQGLAIVGAPLILLLFERRYSRAVDLWTIVGLYGLAKVFEVFDAAFFRAGLGVSGHTLKHILAALAAWTMVSMLRKRRPVESGEPAPVGAAAR
jgi:ABC-type thiamin/hydroxymethylpyrimidine transport system permease subunit